jgi:nucleoside-diphosphate-sugar epimerase
MPKCLITGGVGFIGSHLVDRLSLTEAELVVIDNFDAYYSRDEKLANISPHVLSGRVALLEADILDNSAFDSIASRDPTLSCTLLLLPGCAHHSPAARLSAGEGRGNNASS